MSNEVPQLFDWDQVRNQPGDRWAREELNHSAVEFVAPTEYMVRPPQPAVYVFLIDVSHAAVQSGEGSRLPLNDVADIICVQVWSRLRRVPSWRTWTVYLTRTTAPKWRLSRSTRRCISSRCP
jgi:hypothetical protein